jgi:SAM-dependent methyltransferase
MSDFIKSITTPAMRTRLAEIALADARARAMLMLLGPGHEGEWLHVIAAAADEQLRRALPPLPPIDLRKIVAAWEDEMFLWQGMVDVVGLLDVYERHAQRRPPKPRVFDFGCGCGRMTRFLHLSDRYETIASDANPDHVTWCQANLANVRTFRNGLEPPLGLPSGSIDFCYALSILTHFPRPRALAWMRELARIVTPGGVLAVTIHGPRALDVLDRSDPHRKLFGFSPEHVAEVRSAVAADGFLFLPYREPELHAANVGDDYGSAFFDPAITDIWPDALELIEHIPGGIRDWQDILVFRRRS